MSAADNAELVRRYFQKVDAGYYAADAELQDMSQPQALQGREAIRDFLAMYLGEAFPDGAYQLHRVLADEVSAAAEWTFRGTNTGPLMGEPATGREVVFSGVTVYDIRDGLFTRACVYYDTGLVADQLGLVGQRLPLRERERWTEWWGSRRA
jgi:steroid delta-isomerase-like uncharacterized protein